MVSFAARSMPDQIADEVQEIAREAALPARPGESAKAARGRAWRRVRTVWPELTDRRLYDFWYGRAKLIRGEELELMRRVRILLLEDRLQRAQTEQALMESQLEDLRKRCSDG